MKTIILLIVLAVVELLIKVLIKPNLNKPYQKYVMLFLPFLLLGPTLLGTLNLIHNPFIIFLYCIVSGFIAQMINRFKV